MYSGDGGDAQQQHSHHDDNNRSQSSSRSSTQSSWETKYDEKEYLGDEYGSAVAQPELTMKVEKGDGVEIFTRPVQQTPRTPPPVVTRSGGERLMSIDSTWTSHSAPLSPTETLSDGKGKSFSLLFGELNRFCASPGKNQNIQSAQRKDSSNIAAPAHIVAKPRKSSLSTSLPSTRTRYDRPIVIPRTLYDGVTFKPLQTKLIYGSNECTPWTSYVHPDGLRYFRLEKGDGNNNHFTYLTEENLYNPSAREEIYDFINQLENVALRFERHLPENVEAVLTIEVQVTDNPWHYYLIDLDRKELFWLHDFDASLIVQSVDGVENIQQLKHYFDFEFWCHVEQFPCHRSISPGLLEEIMGYTTHGCIDAMTSLDTTVPYSASNLRDLSGLVKQMISLHRSGKAHDYIVSASARIMSIIANERFWNFAGSHGARVVRDHSVRGDTCAKSWLIRILSPLLFFAPDTHLLSIEKIFIDGQVKQYHWDKFLTRLETDWEQFVLYATVLLTANVSFLAIPTVISNQGPLIWASPAQIFSQVSIVTSLGSIILGLLLVRQHRRQTRESADEAAMFLARRSHHQLGMETLAIMYSLPYAMLMWGMLTFLPSIAITCFLNIQGNFEGLLPRIVYACTWLAVGVLIFWTVLTGWETKAKKSWRDLIPFWGFWVKKKPGDEEGANTSLGVQLEDDRASICSATTTRSWKRRLGKGMKSRLGKRKSLVESQ